jgi:2-hydroxy-3-keto-5-methylthiopentenyl-1-phosphate phosphatase
MVQNLPFELHRVHIITDFDGTVTDRDTLATLLDRFGSPEWVSIEEQVERDQLTVDEAFQRQMALLNVSLEEALCTLDDVIEVDDGVGYCAEKAIEAGGRFTVVSAGFREIINHLLEGKIPDGVAIHANELEIQNGRWKVIPSPSPKIRGLCTHCKRYWVEKAREAGDVVVYVGDGFTDRCPAEAADHVYAKDSLLRYRRGVGLDVSPLRDFRSLWFDLVGVGKGIRDERSQG